MATKKSRTSNKKSRTSNKKSNDKQQKLLALVLVVLFIGLGVLLVVSSYAARGGGKGKPGGTRQFVTTPYGISAVGGTWGPYGVPSSFTITDKLTGLPLASLAGVETLGVLNQCYQNGVKVGEGEFTVRSVTTSGTNYSSVWTSGGADCTATLRVIRNNDLVATASTTYTVAP